MFKRPSPFEVLAVLVISFASDEVDTAIQLVLLRINSNERIGVKTSPHDLFDKR